MGYGLIIILFRAEVISLPTGQGDQPITSEKFFPPLPYRGLNLGLVHEVSIP